MGDSSDATSVSCNRRHFVMTEDALHLARSLGSVTSFVQHHCNAPSHSVEEMFSMQYVWLMRYLFASASTSSELLFVNLVELPVFTSAEMRPHARLLLS